jgi:hypothetical protein
MAGLKLTIAAENERQHVAEKRRVYVSLLAAHEHLCYPLFAERNNGCKVRLIRTQTR